VPGGMSSLVEGERLNQIGMGNLSPAGGDVLSKLHVCLLPAEDLPESNSRLLSELDGLHQVLHLHLGALIDEGINPRQLEGLEIPVRELCFLDLLVVRESIGSLL